MKKRVLVFIDIDTNVTGNSGTGPYKHDSPHYQAARILGANDAWSVKIQQPTDDSNGTPVQDVLAHELGHMVLSVLELPGGIQDDPRSHLKEHSCPACDPKAEKITLAEAYQEYYCEQSAWGIARKMFTLNPVSEPYALSTYQEHIDWIKAVKS